MSATSQPRSTFLGGRSARRRTRLGFTGVLLTGPAIGALVLTVFFPLVWTVWLSFQQFTLAGGGQEFVGLRSYQRILTSTDFVSALVQTLGYVAVTLVVELVIGLALAHLLSRSTRVNRGLRLVVAIPLMIAPVVASMAFRFLFADGYGLVNHGLHVLGLPEPSWFGTPWMARTTVLITNLWLALPFVVLVLLAGISGIPLELEESARVDGANTWRIFLHITLPLLRPSILVILVIRLADAFRVFDSVYVLTGGGPANSTQVMSTYLFRTMFETSDFPSGAAVTVLFVLIVGLLAGGIFALLREGGQAR